MRTHHDPRHVEHSAGGGQRFTNRGAHKGLTIHEKLDRAILVAVVSSFIHQVATSSDVSSEA